MIYADDILQQLDFFWFHVECQVSNPILIISIRKCYVRDSLSELRLGETLRGKRIILA